MRRLCAVPAVHHSGYYAWHREPYSKRSQDDRPVSALAHQSWVESGRVYGYPKVCNDLRERCGKHRVARLMRQAGWKSQTGYTRRPGFRSGTPAVVAPNHLKRACDVTEPNTVWVTDITYIRTHEGWLYLSVVLDLFSRQIVGWSMGERMTRDLAIGSRYPVHSSSVR